MSVAEKVRAAADYVDRVGLHKGWFFGPGSGTVDSTTQAVRAGRKCCTLGALYGHGVSEDIVSGLEAYLAETHPRVERWDFANEDAPVANIPEWNDRPSRRKKDVVKLLRGYADRLDAQPV